jgi:secreted Zn-dependent insulinase-like peptidase
MLARDPELSTAAASLTVGVGAFQDSDEFQGLPIIWNI